MKKETINYLGILLLRVGGRIGFIRPLVFVVCGFYFCQKKSEKFKKSQKKVKI